MCSTNISPLCTFAPPICSQGAVQREVGKVGGRHWLFEGSFIHHLLAHTSLWESTALDSIGENIPHTCPVIQIGTKEFLLNTYGESKGSVCSKGNNWKHGFMDNSNNIESLTCARQGSIHLSRIVSFNPFNFVMQVLVL